MTTLQKIARHIDGNDVLAVVGIALLGVGLWWVYPPVALIVVGSLLVKLAIWGR